MFGAATAEASGARRGAESANPLGSVSCVKCTEVVKISVTMGDVAPRGRRPSLVHKRGGLILRTRGRRLNADAVDRVETGGASQRASPLGPLRTDPPGWACPGASIMCRRGKLLSPLGPVPQHSKGALANVAHNISA
jgi:hypothetical protein